jgi:hypothetical protein
MTKFKLNYHKPKKIALEVLAEQNKDTYQPFDITSFQLYHPIYKLFFELNEMNYNSIAFNHRFHMVDLHTVWDNETSQNTSRQIFLKFAPLLDPVRYLIGKYKTNHPLSEMPSLTNTTHEKLSSIHNCSYIDNLFCYLSNQMLHCHSFLHGIEYYGSYIGNQKHFKMNLADDMDYLIQSEYFNNNRNKIYEIELELQLTKNPFQNFGSRNNKDKLLIHNLSNIEIEDLDIIEQQEVSPDESTHVDLIEEECIYEKSSVVSSEDSSNNSELNYSSQEEDEEDEEEEDEEEEDDEDDEEEDEEEEDEEEEDEDEDDEEDEDDKEEEDKEEDEGNEELQTYAYIYDFPVQMICLEKCVGTLDSLFMKRKLDMDQSASALFQIIMILMAYQKAFKFTHNDLHTNNVMYVKTDEPFLYYKAENKRFKVPTYGRIFKLIDFGRAIYRFQGKIFCSDSFAPGGDASTQYNCEPFINKNKPRLEPNMSFDLCRLGCSIYDFILDPEEDTSENDLFQELILDFVTDDNGKNILYKKNGDERYPNFKLYKMIARTVHNKTPADQLNKKLFSSFHVPSFPEDVHIMDIDELPSYI